jgi:hypothetical protein
MTRDQWLRRAVSASACAVAFVSTVTPAWSGTGFLEVKSIPRGARVHLDGAEAPLGRTPYYGPVEAGPHQVTLRLDGWEDATFPVEVKKTGGAPYTVELDPLEPMPSGPVSPAMRWSIRQTIHARRRAMEDCLETSVPAGSTLAGRIVVAFQIERDGRTSRVAVERAELSAAEEGGTELTRCLADVFTGLLFYDPPPADKAPLPVRFPVIVRAPAATAGPTGAAAGAVPARQP